MNAALVIDASAPVPPARILTAPELDGDEWAFPASWSPVDREAWEAACGEIIHHTKRAEEVQGKAAAMLVSPAFLLEMKRAEVAEVKRASEEARRQAEGEIHWLKTRATFGVNDVRRVDSAEGDVIIMRRPSESAVDASHERMNALVAAHRSKLAPGATPEQIDTHERAGLMIARDVQRDQLILHTAIAGLDTKASADRLRVLMAAHWGLWPRLLNVRNEMIAGWRAAEGKDFAPSS